MIFNEITLQNFRGIENQTFEFRSGFNIIAGINGKGKTSILDAISIISAQLLWQLFPSRIRKRVNMKDIRINKEFFRIEAQVNCSEHPIKFTYNYPKSKENRNTKLPSSLIKSIIESYGYDKNKTDDSVPIAVQYTTDRARYLLPINITKIAPPLDQKLAYLGALDNRVISFKDFLERYNYDAETGNKKVIGPINEAIKIFLEGFENIQIEKNEISRSVEKLKHVNKITNENDVIENILIATEEVIRPQLKINKGENKLDISQLSDGERNLLCTISDLSRRLALANPKLENPLEGSGIVLIDELELHLHPKWQREIVNKFKQTFPNIQFFATTHSPFIIQSLTENDKLILLDGEIKHEYLNKGIEEIVMQIMGVELPWLSHRYLQMLNAAKEYLELLEKYDSSTLSEKEEIRIKLSSLIKPYSDNPAYTAYLEMNRVKTFKE